MAGETWFSQRGGDDELFIQVFTDPRQERDYYIELVDVTRGWKIEAVRLLPTALHQAPFIPDHQGYEDRQEEKLCKDDCCPEGLPCYSHTF